MKNVCTTILFGMLSFVTLISCDNEDSSDEEQSPEISEIEDFANLKGDSKFLEYIERSIIFSSQIVNPEITLELHQKTNLTDQDNLQLAKALGLLKNG